MLNSDQLSKYIANPGLLSAWSMKEIQLLTDQYPFFQTARLLEVKNFHATGSSDFKSKLNFCAAYATDRRILYALIYPEDSKLSDSVATTKSGRETKPTLQENIADTLNAQVDITRSLDPDKAELKPIIALDINKEYGEAREKVKHTTENEIAEKENVEIGITGRDIVDAGTTERDPIETTTIIKDFGEEGKAEEGTDSSIIWLDESDTGPVLSMEEQPPSALQVNEPVDLIDLDDSRTTEPLPIAETKMDDQMPEAVIEMDEKLLPDAETSVSNHELINRFIETSPRMAPPPETDQPVDVSADSIKEDEGFLTDTLARIYIKQGYYAKAIFAYEKLVLKFPEKSIYFAAQIEAIKNIMNKAE